VTRTLIALFDATIGGGWRSALLLWLNIRWRETNGYFDWLNTVAPDGFVQLAWTECVGRGFPATFEARLRYPGGNRDFFDWDS